MSENTIPNKAVQNSRCLRVALLCGIVPLSVSTVMAFSLLVFPFTEIHGFLYFGSLLIGFILVVVGGISVLVHMFSDSHQPNTKAPGNLRRTVIAIALLLFYVPSQLSVWLLVKELSRKPSQTLYEAVTSPYPSKSEIEDFILKDPQSINTINSTYGDTPLYYAVQSNAIRVVRILLKNGANPSGINCEGDTPLHRAVPFVLDPFFYTGN